MSALRSVPVADAEEDLDSGFFFTRLGEVCFTRESHLPSLTAYRDVGALQVLAVSNKYGVTVFIDPEGAAHPPCTQLARRMCLLQLRPNEHLLADLFVPARTLRALDSNSCRRSKESGCGGRKVPPPPPPSPLSFALKHLSPAISPLQYHQGFPASQHH